MLRLVLATLLATHSSDGAAQTTRPADRPRFDTAVLAIADPAVQNELRLRPDQKFEIDRLFERVGPPIWVMRDWPLQKSRDRLEPLIGQVEREVRSILTGAQRRRLEQVMIQQRGVEGLLRPEVVQVLKISAEQVVQLQSAFSEGQRELQEPRRTAGEPAGAENDRVTRDVLRREQRRVLAILTAEQTRSWAALRGKPFDFSSLRPFSVAAPEFQADPKRDSWLNSEPLSMAGLRGRVVVVHFWTFGCSNCIHNYEWYKAWQRDFGSRGVTLIGIHTPETAGERDVSTVRSKAADNGLVFPILIDNQQQNWEAWGNNMWPSVYLVDRRGRVRYWWYGELKWGGRDGEKLMRARIDELLREVADPVQSQPP